MPQGVRRSHGDSEDELAVYRAMQEAEYMQYVAKVNIYAGSALAYRQGDPVPSSNVKLHHYDEMGLVEERAPAAAEAPEVSEEENPADA